MRYSGAMAKRKNEELVTSPAVERMLVLLKEGRIRELHDITDLCAETMSAIVSQELTTGAARELRQWAELMFTCVQAQNPGDGDTNFITTLIQMNSPKPALTGIVPALPDKEEEHIIDLPIKASG